MFKISLLFIFTFFFINVFSISCKEIGASKLSSVNLNFLINSSTYNGTLNINKLEEPTLEYDDSNSIKFPSDSFIRIGDLKLIAESCYTKEDKSYIIAKLNLHNNFSIELDSQVDSIAQDSSILTEDYLMQHLIKNKVTNLQFKPISKKRIYRKADTASDLVDSPNEGATMTNQHNIEKVSSSKRFKPETINPYQSTDVKSNDEAGTSSEIRSNKICLLLLKEGSGVYEFMYQKGELVQVYVHSLKSIKKWFMDNNNFIEFESIAIDTKIKRSMNILKDCKDTLSGRTVINYLSNDNKNIEVIVWSVKKIKSINKVNNQYNFYDYIFDKPGRYSIFNSDHALLGEFTISVVYVLNENIANDKYSKVKITYKKADFKYKNIRGEEVITKIKRAEFKYKPSGHYTEMHLSPFFDTMKRQEGIHFNSFQKLEDKSDVSLIVDKKSNPVVESYSKEDLDKDIKKLNLPNLEETNFCNLFIYPGDYRIEFNDNTKMIITVSSLINIDYDVKNNSVRYLIQASIGRLECKYYYRGSIFDKKKITEVIPINVTEKINDNEIAKFIKEDKACLKLINTGNYDVTQIINLYKRFVKIKEVLQVQYDLRNKNLFIKYGDATLYQYENYPDGKPDYKRQYAPLRVESCYHYLTTSNLNRKLYDHPLYPKGDKNKALKFQNAELLSTLD